MWSHLAPEWQCCIEEAWEAYCHGSLPHGAVVLDGRGSVVARGRNHIREQSAEGRQFAGNRLAHAELNALLAMDWRAVDVYNCQLYSIIEPCPMCIGAVGMAHMRGVHYAVRDGGAGASGLVDASPFLQTLQVVGPQDGELEYLLMAVQVEATLSQSHPNPQAWIDLLSRHIPAAATFGNQLFVRKVLPQWKKEERDAAFVLDQLHELYMQQA